MEDDGGTLLVVTRWFARHRHGLDALINNAGIHASGGQPDRAARMRLAAPMKREGYTQEVAH